MGVQQCKSQSIDKPTNPARAKHNPEQHQIDPNQYITIKKTAELHGVGLSTAWKMIKDGRLPAPKKFGPRCTRMRYGDLFPRQAS